MGTLATCWPRARWSTCGDSTGPTPARAAAMSSAVRTAVPLGESTLVSRCASTISMEGKNGAAAAASAEPRTEPSEKFGMKTAPVPAASTSGRTSAMRSADQPGGADEDVHAPLDRGADDVDRHGGRRRVDDEIGSVELGEIGPRRERRDQLEPVELFDHAADDAAELAGASHDGHARRHAVHPTASGTPRRGRRATRATRKCWPRSSAPTVTTTGR